MTLDTKPSALSRQPPGRRVAVTGVGVISPIGTGKAKYLESLRTGRSGVSEITAFDTSRYSFKKACEVKDFDPTAHFTFGEIRRMDRATQFVLGATDQALSDAGLNEASLSGTNAAVIFGTTLGGMLSGEKYFSNLLQGRRRPAGLRDFLSSAASDQVSIRYGLRGANLTFSTACSTGLHCIGYGFDLIRSGMAEVVIAGAHDTMAQMTATGFGRLRCITGDDIRPFDKHRSGFFLGEGCGVLILEEYERSRRRNAEIQAEVLGYGGSSDAFHMTAPHRSGEGAASSMEQALADANVEAKEINYIKAHGTATPQNDQAETLAIKRVFGDLAYKIPVSSIKAMIGHTLGAAGALEAIGAILCCRNGLLPPTINYQTPDPGCDLDYVPNVCREGRFPLVLCNSFGFGGNNASVVFKVA